ncbi:EamA family transporter [Methanolacinia petrolearia]|uniref:EamA family transporter n=1 Tax=Methanolacinia petrolearia TaxID=54120 RepID=UPI003BAA25B9
MFKKKSFYFLFIILSILFQSLSGIFGKYAAISMQTTSFIEIIINIFYILSLICLCLQAIVWQQALKYYDISFAYPFQSLTMFVILIFSKVFFQELISELNVIGISIIIFGIFLISNDNKRSSEV